jgi:hypothetical protein
MVGLMRQRSIVDGTRARQCVAPVRCVWYTGVQHVMVRLCTRLAAAAGAMSPGPYADAVARPWTRCGAGVIQAAWHSISNQRRG